MAANCSRHWTPPKKGSFVVNCAARTGHGIAGISAIARDCNGDVIAATVGRKKYERKIDAQLQSILAALELINKLTVERGIIKKNQAITIETHHKRAIQMFNGAASDEIYVDDEDDASDDDDVCSGEEYSVTLIGEAELEAGLPQDVKDLIERDKRLAGLGVPVSTEVKSVGKSPPSGKGKDVVKSAASKVASNALSVKASLEEANQANALESSHIVTGDSTASEKMIKGLSVEDLKIV